MTSAIVAGRELCDLLVRLESAASALYDTHGLLNDGDPDSVAIVTMDNILFAIAALDAATNYLTDLREQTLEEK